MHPTFREDLMRERRRELEKHAATAWWYETDATPDRRRLRLPRLRIVTPAWRRLACHLYSPGR
jgi:hypothetical protein